MILGAAGAILMTLLLWRSRLEAKPIEERGGGWDFRHAFATYASIIIAIVMALEASKIL